MSDAWPDDPLQVARFWVDVTQHTSEFRDVTKREAGTGRVMKETHGFNTWVEKNPEQRREALERGVPWTDVPPEVKEQMIEGAIVTEPRPDHLEPEHPHSRIRYREVDRFSFFEESDLDRRGILNEIEKRIATLVSVGYEYCNSEEASRAYPKHEGAVSWDALTREDKREAITRFVNWSGVEVKDEERIILNVIDGLPRDKWMDGIAAGELQGSDYDRLLDETAAWARNRQDMDHGHDR